MGYYLSKHRVRKGQPKRTGQHARTKISSAEMEVPAPSVALAAADAITPPAEIVTSKTQSSVASSSRGGAGNGGWGLFARPGKKNKTREQQELPNAAPVAQPAPSVLVRPPIEAVWNTHSEPSLSFVDREGDELTKIKDSIARRDKITVILGAPLTGKTQFVNRAVSAAGGVRVSINGADITDYDLFWLRVIAEADPFVRAAYTKESSLGAQMETEASVGLGLKGLAEASAAVRAGIHAEQRVTEIVERIGNVRTIGKEILRTFQPFVFLDDFHEIRADEVRIEIAKAARTLTQDNVAKFIVLATSKPELSIFQADKQISGRTELWLFPVWEQGDLKQIVGVGVRQLGCRIAGDTRDILVRECWGNPGVLNDLCWSAATYASRRVRPDVWRSTPAIELRREDVGHALSVQVEQYRSAFERVPEYAFNQSSVGGKDHRYPMLNESAEKIGDASVYRLILEALRTPEYAGKHGVGELVLKDKIRSITGNRRWGPTNWSSHLQALANTNFTVGHRNLFQNKLPERPLHYDVALSKFYVTDPTLRTYLHRGGPLLEVVTVFDHEPITAKASVAPRSLRPLWGVVPP